MTAGATLFDLECPDVRLEGGRYFQNAAYPDLLYWLRLRRLGEVPAMWELMPEDALALGRAAKYIGRKLEAARQRGVPLAPEPPWRRPRPPDSAICELGIASDAIYLELVGRRTAFALDVQWPLLLKALAAFGDDAASIVASSRPIGPSGPRHDGNGNLIGGSPRSGDLVRGYAAAKRASGAWEWQDD
jgi:hypothetical protein